jgi:hypothetical protein
MPRFLFIFTLKIGIETSTWYFYIQYFAWGLHGGVDLKGSGGLFVMELN